MLNIILLIITSFAALFGVGFFSYTYIENSASSQLSPPVVTHSVSKVVSKTTTMAKVATTTKVKTSTKVPAVVALKTNVSPVISATTKEKTIVAPGPLRITPSTTAPSGALTMRGVIEYTNIARAQNGGFLALTENFTLNLDAQMKLQDMFTRQYFEHISPVGVGPGDIAKKVGYEYVIVGENLALGDFASDAKLVDAWMNSPGHRANILNAHYLEIGVAVGRGMYKGRETWLAVQSFGMPLSACPSIDTVMKAQIDTNNAQISDMKIKLAAKKVQMESTSKDDPNYNTYVAEFNALVSPYNMLIESTRVLVATYNLGVRAYNVCVGSADNSSVSSTTTVKAPAASANTGGGNYGEIPSLTIRSPTSDYFTQRGKIYEPNGQEIQIRGISHFGFNGITLQPQFLWAMGWKEQIAQMKSLGFNTIRVPFVPDTLYNTTPVDKLNYIDAKLNPDLLGKTPLQVLDLWMAEADRQGMYILLDFHSVSKQRQYPTWFVSNPADFNLIYNNQAYTKENWTRDLAFVAQRYAQLTHFFGIDIYNEPNGLVRWGAGDGAMTNSDLFWKPAAEFAAAAILKANPNLMIFVQGINGNYDGIENSSIPTNWGENFQPQAYQPLNIPKNKLVLTPHTYGPDVYVKSSFGLPTFPANLQADWESLFGQFSQTHAVVIGEWGGKYGQGTGGQQDITWQNAFVDYLLSKGIRNSFYWCYTPNSGDTGGILDDALSVRQDKLALLKKLWGAPPSTVTPPVISPPPVIVTPTPAATPISTPPTAAPISSGAKLTSCANILPVGDSITLGVNGGYRNNLYTGLLQNNCGVSYVGTQLDQYTRVADKDHEGHPGFNIDNIAGSVNSWTSSTQPNIILLMAGTNDTAWWSAKNADEIGASHNALIDQFKLARPDAWIFVASLPPQASAIIQPNNVDRAVLTQQLNAVIRKNVNARAAAGQRVRFVDVNSVLTTADLYDGIHPTEEAHSKIAQKFLEVIRATLNSSVITPPIAPAPAFKQQTIWNFSPASGPEGTVITVNGSGFAGSNLAWIGAARNGVVKVISDSQLQVTVPAGATTGAIGIFNPAYVVFTPGVFTVTSNPVGTYQQQNIFNFSPSSGPVGIVVTVNGNGFIGSNLAWVGAAHNGAVNVISDSQVQVTIPVGATSGAIGIFNPGYVTFTPSSFTVQ